MTNEQNCCDNCNEPDGQLDRYEVFETYPDGKRNWNDYVFCGSPECLPEGMPADFAIGRIFYREEKRWAGFPAVEVTVKQAWHLIETGV